MQKDVCTQAPQTNVPLNKRTPHPQTAQYQPKSLKGYEESQSAPCEHNMVHGAYGAIVFEVHPRVEGLEFGIESVHCVEFPANVTTSG